MGPFDIWSQLQALQPPNQYGQPPPRPGAPDPMVARQEGLDGGHGNDGNGGRRPGPPTKPRWREMDWGDRLTALGAIVGDLDPRMQGQGYRAFREEYAGRGQADLARQQAQAQLERQQAFRDAYTASLDENGNLDPAKLQRNLAPYINDFGDITALNGLGPKPDPLQFGDLDGNGVTDVFRRSQGEAYVDAHALGTPGAPLGQPRPGVPAPQGLPPLPPGLTLVNPNQAAPTGAAAPQGIDWNRLVQRESGGAQSAVSPKGAFGRAQLMPGTADYVARRLGDPSLAQRARTDPAVNERLGQAYLQEQIQAFGNPAVALAAYNAGPGKAREWVRRFGQPTPGREREWAMQIPYRETRDYVLNILEPR